MKNTGRFYPFLLALVLVISLVSITASAEQSAPTAESQELTTYRGVSIGGKLTASDPEGNELSFEITTEPVKGTVELGEDGSFVYTPNDGKKGRDYFGFRAVSSSGATSEEATVIIRIEKQKSTVSYSDMNDSPLEYAATLLAEEGIYVGRNIGGKYVFEPETELSRADFLAMCMKLGQVELLSGVTRTGFADDDDIPAWAKACVSTALLNGYISGSESDGRFVFEPERGITRAEAIVMLGEVMGTEGLVAVSEYDEEAVPAWASSHTAGLEMRDIVDVTDNMYSVITRADAAEMFEKALEYLEK